jgi:hypothetical protein
VAHEQTLREVYNRICRLYKQGFDKNFMVITLCILFVFIQISFHICTIFLLNRGILLSRSTFAIVYLLLETVLTLFFFSVAIVDVVLLAFPFGCIACFSNGDWKKPVEYLLLFFGGVCAILFGNSSEIV